MSQHRYILEAYGGMKTRHRCPSCQKRDKTFSFYIDIETSEPVHPSVGRCNRESNCGYHYTPKQFFNDNNISSIKPQPSTFSRKVPTPKPRLTSFIPPDVFKSSLKGYVTNHFTGFLIKQLGGELASKLVSKYFIGTSKHWPGATIFWQIDHSGKIRSGKIMLYDALTGKRSKDPYKHPTWVHKVLELPEFNLHQCLFGEHLLKTNPTAPVAIVESEKTAIIASEYLPDFIWLACGGKSNLNIDRCQVLKGRNVILYPDLNAFDQWTEKAKELSPIARVTVSDLLERKGSPEEKNEGLDLADYLLRFSPKNHERTLDPINILIKHITEIPCEIHTGPLFENAVLVWVKTAESGDYEILFDKLGNPLLEFGIADRIASFYKKNFVEVLFNGIKALAHINSIN